MSKELLQQQYQTAILKRGEASYKLQILTEQLEVLRDEVQKWHKTAALLQDQYNAYQEPVQAPVQKSTKQLDEEIVNKKNKNDE